MEGTGMGVYEYWLARIKGISGRKKRKLREEGGGAYNVYRGGCDLNDLLKPEERSVLQKAQQEKEEELQEQFDLLQKKDIRFVPYFDPAYPGRLAEITSPPYALFVRGSLPDPNRPAVAIVGARTCTSYGEKMALRFGQTLAEAGVQVISGMARGIDGAGQRGAITGGGTTYGVLGGGVDICYPRENIGLYMDMQKQGGLLSEQLPGSAPKPAYFPARNRIISGLSDVVLVLEAREKSGSLITADMALDMGKDVYALPGPVTSSLSAGCHRLIRQGAGILLGPEDLLEELGLAGIRSSDRASREPAAGKEAKDSRSLICQYLNEFPKGIEELTRESGLSPQVLMRELVELELEGKVQEVSKNFYVKI